MKRERKTVQSVGIMIRTLIFCCLVLTSFFSITAQGQEEESEALPTSDFTALRQMDTATVDQIIDPLRLRLKDKRIIQLSGLDIPDLKTYETGDIALSAHEFLKDLLENKQVRLYQTKNAGKGGRTNRMGHLLAHLERNEENVWIQGALLAQGMARILPSQRTPEMAKEMIALENRARQERRGLWADEQYAVITPETADDHPEGWAIFEGRIRKTAVVRNKLYLNFGDDWRTDFTVAVEPAVRRQLVKAGIDPMAYGGKTIRVHGWLRSYNGPYMELIHPVWLETLTSENAPIPP